MYVINGLGVGGAERNLVEFLKHTDHQKYAVRVCSVGQGGPLQSDIEAMGIPVDVLTKRQKFDVTLIFRLANLLRSTHTEIVTTILFYADVVGAFAARLAGVPTVVSWSAGSTPKGSKNSKLRHVLSYKIIRYFINTMVAVSDATREFMIRERSIPEERIVRVWYGVDLSKFSCGRNGITKRRELGLKETDRVIGVVARLTEQKGHMYLIEAVAEIIDKFPNLKVLFVGDGPLRTELVSKVERLGLHQNFFFLGTRHDVKELLHVFEIFVLPSLWEGLPNVLLEAMACAKPIIATAVDGSPEAVVHGDTGLLVPPRDPRALAQALTQLLSDPEKLDSMSRQARLRAEEFFSIQKQVENFDKLYDRLLGEARFRLRVRR